MLGIASKNRLDRQSISMMLPSTHVRGKIDGLIFYNSWAAVTGMETFEDENVSVVSESELYNIQEVSSLVSDKPKNDAHLAGLLFLKYGMAAFEKLSGQFSFCIIDKKNQKAIVVTDRFGVKPVVYYCDEDSFIFSSRINAICSLPQFKIRDIDYEAVVDYINLSAIPTPKTIYKGIRKLPPGCFALVENGKSVPKIDRYYDIDYLPKISDSKFISSKLPEVIESSVAEILAYEGTKGRNTGAFLSGGTDSSTLTGMIKKLDNKVKTFSIGFDEPGYNELHYARIAAKHFGAEHHEYVVTPEDVLKTIDIILDAYDEPFGNASAVPTYFCARLAKENGVDALFAGDGGDEIFGGNERYVSDRIFSIYHRIPYFMRKGLIEPLVAASPQTFSFIEKGKKYIKRANIPQPDRFYSYNPVMAFGKENIFSPDLLLNMNEYSPLQWAYELYNSVKASEELDRLLYLDMKFTITDNDLRKVSNMSEKAGVIAAYPFLAHHVVDFASKIPCSLKVKGSSLRHIFKTALKDFLPPEIIKKKKHGFGLPIGVWIRTKKNISSFVRDALLTADCSVRPFFREGFIAELFRLHGNTGAAFYGDIIWLLLILELWHKRRKFEAGKILRRS